MKKLKLWSMMMLAAMTMSVATSCGGDDGGDVGNRPVNPDNPDNPNPSGGKDAEDNPDPNAIISFKDNKVAMICIANFDINKDNQLSYGEAATVSSLKGIFTGKDITFFDELKYFTGLSEISDEAFKNCSYLTSVTIPNSVTRIEDYAFLGCNDLTSVTIPNSVTSIGKYAFFGCFRLTSITIPNSVTSIGYYAFRDCFKLTSIMVENGNSKYDSRNNCNAIIETASNTLIAGCKNTIIPNSVTSIGFAAFAGRTSLTSITIPNSVTIIGNEAFAGCSGLTSITIPNSVTSIGEDAFWMCSGLTSFTIPNSVTSIGEDAFWRCSGLTYIVSQIVNPFAVSSILGGNSMYEKVTLYVPKGTIYKYKTTSGWKLFKNIVEQ